MSKLAKEIIITCEYCNKDITRKYYDTQRNGQRHKMFFCNRECQINWRHQRHLFFKKRLQHFERKVWGTTPLKRFGVGNSMKYGRKAEKHALNFILPKLGFTEIINFTNYSSQFYIDFVATYKGKRVLLDVTIKLQAWVPKKVKIANALRMPLFILHVSPNKKLHYLRELPLGRVVSKVPRAFIRQHAKFQRVEKDSYL